MAHKRGNYITALGSGVMQSTVSASNAVAIGGYAGQYVGHSKEASYTTIVGDLAGQYTTGSNNTFMGYSAGKGGTTSAPYSSGTSNVAVGAYAFDGFTTGAGNVAIGYNTCLL